MLGVAATGAGTSTVAVAGLAGLVAGAASMATGEYVSVSSQRDSESADIAREAQEQVAQPRAEAEELKNIYVKRGLDVALAEQVAAQLMRVDPLGAHLRDELGLTRDLMARPGQAAAVSALSFACGAALPVATLLVTPGRYRIAGIAVTALVLLAGLGALGGMLGGGGRWRAMLRVVVGGGLAMAITGLIGRLVAALGLGGSPV